MPEGAGLTRQASSDLPGAYGIPLSPSRVVATADEAVEAYSSHRYPCPSNKAHGADLIHKSVVGGVRLSVCSPLPTSSGLGRKCDRRSVTACRGGGQPMAAPGVETIVKG